MQNSSSSPRSMVMLLDFEKIFSFFLPQAYKRTARWEKRKKIPKYECIKYRAYEYITALISDLSIIKKQYSFTSNIQEINKHSLCFLQTKKASLLRNPKIQTLTNWWVYKRSASTSNCYLNLLIENRTKQVKKRKLNQLFSNRWTLYFMQNSSSSPRSISIGQLNTLLYLHLRPINLLV